MVSGGPDKKILPNLFSEQFLDRHAGKIITDPNVAIVELVANCWDAGAKKVYITWPAEINGYFDIVDNGTGMSKEKFEKTWPKFNYNRVTEEGEEVIFPEPSISDIRTAYGRNGKGRHGVFCFSNYYNVESWQDGKLYRYHVKRSHGANPIEIEPKGEEEKEGHGTKIFCRLNNHNIAENDVMILIGSRFITDPSFEVYLNGKIIELLDLNPYEVDSFEIDGNPVKIYRLDGQSTARTSKTQGVAWWVNKRLVGEHSWEGIEGTFIDRRSKQARRFTYIVVADFLKNEVKEDWTGFKDTPLAKKSREIVNKRIINLIHELLKESRSAVKRTSIWKNKDLIKQLTPISQEKVGEFVEELQKKCPSMGEDTLTSAVEVFVKMEISKTGYKLLQQLSEFSPNDIDSMSEILDKWSVTDAKIVLDELYKRLTLIQDLDDLSQRETSDELHELQPIIAEGLWIFGPEYEGPQFLSNRTLLTVVAKFLRWDESKLATPSKRPDFVVLPNGSVSVHASFTFDKKGEVNGLNKVLVDELKKGKWDIGTTEYRQAEDYAIEIRKCGFGLSNETRIQCFVIGASVNPDCTPGQRDGGAISIIPCAYEIILNRAKARTFNLITKIKELKNIESVGDREINDILKQKNLEEFNEVL